MKKSELKALLKIITEEVIAAKQSQLNEAKGLSGMKHAPKSSEHTEIVADSKDLTGPAPKEKQEGKKLPVVKKPANPQKVGNIKEEILAMIREAIEEADVDEARTAGAVHAQYRKEVEPGKWVIMGHPNQQKYPDGTPTSAPKGPYIKQGKNVDVGAVPTKTSVPPNVSNSQKANTTREAIESILKIIWNNNGKNWPADIVKIGEDITNEIMNRANAGETDLSSDPTIIASAISTAKSKIEMEDSDEPVSVDASGDATPADPAAVADAAAASEEVKLTQAIQRAKAKGTPTSPKLAAVRNAFALWRARNKK